MNLIDLVSQLEQAKFARLIRYLFELPWAADQTDKVSTPAVPLDLPETQLLVKLVGQMSARESYLGSWAFQIAHVPAGLCSSEHWRKILLGHLEQGLRALSGHPDPLGALLGSGIKHPYRTLLGPTEGCDYHVVTNMACEGAEEFVHEFHGEARSMFRELLSAPAWHPRFGLGTPETIASHARPEAEQFVRQLFRTPSGYQFVAREGQVTIVPYTEHGSYLAYGERLLSTATLATATSILPIPELNRSAIAELEALINDPKVQEADVQRLFEERPQLLRVINPNYRELMPHLCLSDNRGNRLVPDFLARVEGGLWDLIELKHPRQPLTRRIRGGLKPAARTAAGIAQLLRYRDYFTNQENRQRFAARYGIAPLEPHLVLVGGRGEPPTLAEWRTGLAGYPSATLVSYSYILDRARRCAAALVIDPTVSKADNILESG